MKRLELLFSLLSWCNNIFVQDNCLWNSILLLAKLVCCNGLLCSFCVKQLSSCLIAFRHLLETNVIQTIWSVGFKNSISGLEICTKLSFLTGKHATNWILYELNFIEKRAPEMKMFLLTLPFHTSKHTAQQERCS